MATAINAGMTEERPVLTVSRRLAGPPWRSAERTWTDLCQFWLDVLTQRSFPRLAETAAALQLLAPLGQQWVIRHVLEDEDLRFTTIDLQLAVRVTYQVDPDEDLAPLPVDLLDELPADAPLTLQVHGAALIEEPAIAPLLAAVAEHGLIVQFVPDTETEIPDGDDPE